MRSSLNADEGDSDAPRVLTSRDAASDDATAADDAPAPPVYPRLFSSADTGRYALIVLTLINLLNYIDRYVPSATKQYIQKDLHLSDKETSLPLTAFVIVYMFCSPIFSWLADLGYRRSRLIAVGVVIWSIATAAGALAVGFWTLLISRSLVGVGEAAYATIAPALLSDYYPASRRNAVLSIFYLAIPIGAAMGYALGGEVGGYWGWREAFLVSGAPGLVVAAACLFINEPTPGAADEPIPTAASHAAPRRVGSSHDLMFGLNADHMITPTNTDDNTEETGFAVQSELGGPAVTHPEGDYHPPAAHSIVVRSSVVDDAPQSPIAVDAPTHLVSPPWLESIIMLLRNPTYMFATLGLTAVIYASGGLADWFPSWLNRVHGVDKDKASTMVGAITCVAGILGTAWGSWVGEMAKGRIAQPYLAVPGLNMVVTAGLSWICMLIPNVYAIGVLVFIAQVAMWAYTGPITALTINCVPTNLRVRAFAFQIFLSHALGDAISPSIIGAVSDATGSLRTAMFLVPIAFTTGMVIWLLGWRVLAHADTFDGHDGTSASKRTSRRNSIDQRVAFSQAAATATSTDGTQAFRPAEDAMRSPLIASESASSASELDERMIRMNQLEQHRNNSNAHADIM